MDGRDAVRQAGGILPARPVVGKSLGDGIEAADPAELSDPQAAVHILIQPDEIVGHQAVRITRIVGVMREPPTTLIEPIETGSPAAQTRDSRGCP